MNTLVIVLIAAVCLFGAYMLYGRWLANKWGIDPSAKTPAVVHEDGRDYVPTDGWTVFAHQFSSIAGAGPVTGAIQAAAFGWLPVLLWVLLGGIFFGAVTDFGALYASVKNDGKSMGMLIEKYIGKTGRKLFLLFCWLFCGIVIAAFADMVAGTFNAYGADGALVEAAQTNGAAGMVSIMFMVFAVVFGLLQKNLHFTGWKENVISIVFIVLSFVVGANFPIILGKAAWSYITFVYIFFAAVLPMWLLKQPRDHMTTFMFVAMIVGAVLGLIVNHPVMNLPVFTGFTNAKLGTMFPILFVTVACGAVSGFHSLVSSGTSSKTVTNEKDMLKVGYGAMVLESLLAVIALCVAGASAAADGTPADGTPFQIFSRGVASFFVGFGLNQHFASVFMTMCVSALALTSLDAVARIGRMSFQELFSVDDMEHAEGWRKLLCNVYFSTFLTLAFGFLLTKIGYANIWPLFGSANQLLSALVLATLCVFLKVTGRSNKMIFPPLIIMLCVTFTALVQRLIAMVKAISNAAADGTPAAGTPFQIFSRGVAGFFEMFGVPAYAATVFMTMCVSALALTSLDAVARIGRMSFQELFSVDDMEHAEGWRKLLCNVYFSTFLTLVFGFILTKIGYANIWPLFGSANQLLSALVLSTLCVFLKVTGRSNKMLFPPLIIMLCVTFTALVQRLMAMVKAISNAAAVAIPAGETTWGAVFIANGLQLILAVLLIVLGLNIVFHSFSAYKKAEHNSEAKA